MTLYKHELKMNFKSFIIWTLSVGLMCFGCILLYASVESSLSDMGDIFSQMGAMSAAFGMDRISIATMTGYFATEIAMIHALGGAMFAAILGCNLLSKEEFGHTVEFLAVLPIKRWKIVLDKYASLITYLLLFQITCTASYMLGFWIMDEKIEFGHFMTLSLTQALLLIEIGTICFCLSAFSRKNMMGIGLGITLLLFAADLMCRVVPAIENLKYVTPFYYSNATDIFTDTEIDMAFIVISVVLTVVVYFVGHMKYIRKDLNA